MNLKITAAVAAALACSAAPAFASNLTTTINNGITAGTIKAGRLRFFR